jgi:hypothetical protein
MDERIAVFVAWPYANGDVHLGNVAGAYLPADIFARYHRLRGSHVLMVSGSDTHGTPVTVEAARLGISPHQVYKRYHQRFLDDWYRLGVSFDLFTHTDTEQHRAVAAEMFRALYDRGAIVPGTSLQMYCSRDTRFLPDRYVDGTCPHCGFTSARGDQCGAASARVHSGYVRTLADLPWHGVAVSVRLTVRRFVCATAACPRRIFGERLPGIVAPYARRTARLSEAFELIGFVLGGEAGGRVLHCLAMAGSPDTLLRIIRAASLHEHADPRILGAARTLRLVRFPHGVEPTMPGPACAGGRSLD